MVLDEAHIIRNQTSQTARVCCLVEANRRWAITGTPLQNGLGDLGSLLKFLRAYPFDDAEVFKKTIASPFSRRDPTVFASLRILVECIALRRTKEIIPGLPPKEELTLEIEMTGNERKCYDKLVDDMANLVDAKREVGWGFGHHFLTGITRIRRFCAHKQELMTTADLKMFQGLVSDDPLVLDDDDEVEVDGEGNHEILTRQLALDMVRLTRDSHCDQCGHCGKELSLDSSDDEEHGAIYAYMMQCYHPVCPDCLQWWQKGSKKYKCGGPNLVKCCLCRETHRMEMIKLLRQEVIEFLDNQKRLQDNKRVAKKLGPYIGPSTKVQYLIQQLNEFMEWNKKHPDKRAKA